MSASTQKALAKSRATTPIRKHNMYRTRSYSSDVDETLFGSPARHVAQKDTLRINPGDVSWDPPWVTSPRKDGSPLLWTPYDGKDSATKNTKPSSPRRPTTPRNKYRLKKQVPSYVDETLFGTPRKPRQSSPPLVTRDNNAYKQPQATWSPPLATVESDMTIDSKKIEVKADTEANDMRYTPVIKARSGSTINTPQSSSKTSQGRANNGNLPPTKLDFCIENGANDGSSDEHDPDTIVRNALKLAGLSKNNDRPIQRTNSLEGLSSRVTTPGRYFWRRPASPSSTSSRPATTLSLQNVGETRTKVNDFFSATGTSVPLSARGGSRRPDSARTTRTDDSVPGLDISRPPRLPPSGAQTPRTARSTASGHSSIMNRPSWRP